MGRPARCAPDHADLGAEPVCLPAFLRPERVRPALKLGPAPIFRLEKLAPCRRFRALDGQLRFEHKSKRRFDSAGN